ncbi:MAG TPA: exostosin family protein [Tepidisphaeraceae bacterium]|jgi:hypothetical protein
MKLVWHAPRIRVGNWIRKLLGDLVTEEVEDYADTDLSSDSIHVVSINHRPLAEYNSYFEKLRANADNITLFHTGDEWFSGGYTNYQFFDRVIRYHSFRWARGNGIYTIPLGYPNTTRTGAYSIRSSSRSISWSFAGEIKSSRTQMARSMSEIAHHLLIDTIGPNARKLNAEDYMRTLLDSVFCPCPMGNVNIETWRLYEALEYGCIPIVERRLTLDYYNELLGPNPIPSFNSWSDAAHWSSQIMRDPERLDEKQIEIMRWWGSFKEILADDLRSYMQGPSRAAELKYYGQHLSTTLGIVSQPLRLAELMRHQNLSSLRWRIQRYAKRIASS